jgi:hypothetical protein
LETPVTHESTPGGEATDGPERDATLPNAETVPVYDDPADSDAPPLGEHSGTTDRGTR